MNVFDNSILDYDKDQIFFSTNQILILNYSQKFLGVESRVDKMIGAIHFPEKLLSASFLYAHWLHLKAVLKIIELNTNSL